MTEGTRAGFTQPEKPEPERRVRVGIPQGRSEHQEQPARRRRRKIGPPKDPLPEKPKDEQP